jgi:GAF domain-containing protein/HAMP domain-containing protein
MIVPYPTGLEPKNGDNGGKNRGEPSSFEVGARRMVLLRIIMDAILGLLFFYLAYRTGLSALNQLVRVTAVLLFVDLYGFWLLRRHRTTLGVSLVIGGLLVLFLLMNTLFAGLGLILGLAAVIVTAASAIQSVPNKAASWLVTLSAVIGLAITLIDELIPAGNRPAVPPEILTAIPVVVGIFLVIFAYLISRQFTSYTLRTKLVIAFLLVSLIPLSILAYLNTRSTRQALTDAANQALFAAASKTATNVDAYIQKNLDSIQTEAQIPLFRQFVSLTDAERANSAEDLEVIDLLNALESKDPEHIFSYSLLDKDGIVLASTALPTGSRPQFMENDDWVLNNFRLVLLTNYSSVSPVKYSQDMGIASMYFTARVSDQDGKPIGGLITHYDARVLQDLVAQNNNLAGPDSFGVLFDEDQIHLAHGIDPDTIQKTVGPLPPEELARLIQGFRLPNLPAEALTTNLPELSANLENVDKEPYFTAVDVATGDRLNRVAVAELESKDGWIVAFFQPEDVFLAPVARQNRATVILAVLIASLMIGAALGAAQLVANPISRMTRTAVQIAKGDIQARMPVESNDEIGTLAGTFNVMADQLETTLTGLEGEVSSRTADLNRRAAQLQTAAQVAREAASIRDIDQLLDQVTRLISARFNFYHSGIFLLDEAGEYAILRGASSEGGTRMLARDHKLAVGKKGIVGFVAEARKPRIALDVGADATFFDNPDLPLTRSEMALPLMIANQVIGVLDVQSKMPSAFSDEDVEVLQILADQIALAIDNVRLLAASQDALKQLENLYKRQVQQAWGARLKERPIAYRYDRLQVKPADTPEHSSATRVGPNGHQETSNDLTMIAPIALRGQKVGSVVLKRDDGQHPWSHEEKALMGDVVRQLSLALENTRLYEETQERADRERLISEISTAIRRSLDIDTVLHTAAQEIQAALSLEDVEIRVGSRHLQAAKRDTGELRGQPTPILDRTRQNSEDGQ